MKVLVAARGIFALGLMRVVKETCPDAAVMTAATVAEAVEAADRHKPDLILVDHGLRSYGAACPVGRLVKHCPDVPVVVTSWSDSHSDMASAFQSGARAYIPVDMSADVFRHVLSLVFFGEYYFPESFLRGMGVTSPLTASLPPSAEIEEHFDRLTPRQREVLTMIADGKSNRQIAERMNLLTTTVKHHVKEILKKLGATNRTEAASIANRSGYLTKFHLLLLTLIHDWDFLYEAIF
jgi:DNA-binding NarL/FixJ family response regulator